MTRILVISDTHIPRVAHDMPQKIYDQIIASDMVMHAGDFVEEVLLDKLIKLKDTRAVYGNMDSARIQARLKQKETILVEKVRIGMIHGYGAPATIIETVAKECRGADVIVFGHSHAAVNVVKDGVLFFNPGSPTDNIFAKYNSYGILKIDGKDVKGEIIKL